MSKLGIVALMSLSTALAHSGNAIGDVFEDGRVDFKDFSRIPAILEAGRDFTGVKFADVLPEVADLDTDEARQLADHFAQVFNISNDTVEGVIEEGMALVVDAVEAAQAMWAVIQRIRSRLPKIA